MNGLQDEMYRSMLRLEAGKEGAGLSLCRALVSAWNAAGTMEKPKEFDDWLRKVTPICLSMVSDSIELDDSRAPQEQLTLLETRHRDQKEVGMNMKVKVSHLDNVRFSIQAREHSIISDQPTDNSGQDTGFTPPELLLASLGSCAAYYATQYLKTRNLSESGVDVSVTAVKLKQPARMGDFRVQVDCPVPLTEEQRLAMMRSVHQCIVHNTLTSQPEISIELNTPEKLLLQ